MPPYIIGLTGVTGSGKTTVAGLLAARGAAVIQADTIAHETYAPGSEGWREIVEAFGREVLAADGSVDRRKLADIVFADSKALKRLNAITHPRARALIEHRIRELTAARAQVMVLEAALLLEAGWRDLADEVWVTAAPPQICAARAAQRLNISLANAEARVRARLPDKKRRAQADVVIDTSGRIEDTEQAVEAAWARLQQRISAANTGIKA